MLSWNIFFYFEDDIGQFLVTLSLVRSKTLLVVTRLRSCASLETSSTSGCSLILTNPKTPLKKYSVRLIFSIADLQSAEDFDPAEDEGSESAESGEPSYPLRCSLTITKVCKYTRTHTHSYYLCSIRLWHTTLISRLSRAHWVLIPFAKKAYSSSKTCRTTRMLNWRRISPPRLIGNAADFISVPRCVRHPFSLEARACLRMYCIRLR